MEQAKNMSDLQFLEENFAGGYTLEEDTKLDHVLKDNEIQFGFHDFIAYGLQKLYFDIKVDYEILLTDNNRRTIFFYIDTIHDGFWFTDEYIDNTEEWQSIARYDNYTLKIEMTPPVPTARRVTYQFYQEDHGPEEDITKGIKFEMFNGTTSWTMTYKKFL